MINMYYLGSAAISGWLASGFHYLRADEMAAILLLERFYRTARSGPVMTYPWPLTRVVRFPTLQMPLNLEVPITATDAVMADFYREDDSVCRLADLDEEMQRAMADDALSKRSTVIAQAPILFRFKKEELGKFIVEVGTFDRLGEILGFAVRSALEGVLSRVTISTMLERKDTLSRIFSQRLATQIKSQQSRAWGIEIVRSFIGPIGVSDTVETALKERVRLAQEGRGRAEAVGYLERYLKTSEGKRAAELDITRQIYSGANKVIIAPGITGALAGFKELTASV